MRDYRWLNVLGNVIGGKTYVFCSCRDIHDTYSMVDDLNAKKDKITNLCSRHPETSFIDLHKFHQIANIECKDKNECLELCRNVNVVFKEFYINNFGGFAVPDMSFKDVEQAIKGILDRCMRKKNLTFVDAVGFVDSKYRDKTNLYDGQLYIMDNAGKSVKVGLSKDPENRLRNLILNGELYHNASLFNTYRTKDSIGVEASAHACLNDYKYQNPLKSSGRNSQYGKLDEHFNCTPEDADKIIFSALSGYFYTTAENEKAINDFSSTYGNNAYSIPQSAYYYEVGNEKKDA